MGSSLKWPTYEEKQELPGRLGTFDQLPSGE